MQMGPNVPVGQGQVVNITCAQDAGRDPTGVCPCLYAGWDCEQICAAAQAEGLDRNTFGGLNSGGTICCGGKKCACTWPENDPTVSNGYIAECLRRHEEEHLNDDTVICATQCCLHQGGGANPQDSDNSECDAYAAEYECLSDFYDFLEGTPDGDDIGFYMRGVEKAMEFFCQ
jgi:hypothetical protein